MPSIQSPLMNGTRLFLNVLLFLLYLSAAIMALAAVTMLVIPNPPASTFVFSASDKLMVVSVLAYLLIAIYFFRVLRAIVRSVAEGDPFNRANPDRLTRLAWLSTFLWAIDLAYIVWDTPSLAGTTPTDAIGLLAAEGISHTFSLVGPITLFILARVFHHGVSMREDLEGTV
jgi:Protein of unknown function (DUF2975)